MDRASLAFVLSQTVIHTGIYIIQHFFSVSMYGNANVSGQTFAIIEIEKIKIMMHFSHYMHFSQSLYWKHVLDFTVDLQLRKQNTYLWHWAQNILRWLVDENITPIIPSKHESSYWPRHIFKRSAENTYIFCIFSSYLPSDRRKCKLRNSKVCIAL